MRKIVTATLILMSTAFAQAEQSTLKVDDAFVREMPPGRTITAAFFQLINERESDCKLISASSSIAERTEIHNHIHEDGLMKMREVDSVAVPAGETVAFKPGGLHIMLYGVKQGLKDGEQVQMTLTFEECGELPATFEIRSAKR